MDKKRRSSIRKPLKNEDTTEVRINRRISFSAKKNVRVFCVGEEPGNYENSYEMSESSGAGTSKTSSTVNNSTAGGSFNRTGSAAHFTQLNSTEIYADDDKENLKMVNRSSDDHRTHRDDIDSLQIENSINVTLLPDELKRFRIIRASKNKPTTMTTEESNMLSFSMLSESDREELRRPKKIYEVFEKTVDFMRELQTKDETLKDNAAIKEAVSNFEQKLKPITFATESDSFGSQLDLSEEQKPATNKQTQNKTVENYSFMDIDVSIKDVKVANSQKTVYFNDMNMTIEDVKTNIEKDESKLLLQPKQATTSSSGSSTMNKNEEKHNSNNLSAHSSTTSIDSTFSSPLIPEGIVSVDCKKKRFNLRQLNDELEQGRIQIFPNGLKTPTNSEKKGQRSRLWFGKDDHHMELTGVTDRPAATKPRTTLNFSDADIELSNIVNGDFKIPKSLTNTPQRNKRTLRYSQADDLLLDNTNFLTQAKLGDETQSRSIYNENIELEEEEEQERRSNSLTKKVSSNDTIIFDCDVNLEAKEKSVVLSDTNRENELLSGCRKTLHFDNMDIDSSCSADTNKSKSKNRETIHFTNNNTISIEQDPQFNKTDSLERDLRAAQTRLTSNVFKRPQTPIKNPTHQANRFKMLQLTPGRSMIEFENFENEFDATDDNKCHLTTNESFQMEEEVAIENNESHKKSLRQTICAPLDINEIFDIFENSQQKHGKTTVYMDSRIDLDNDIAMAEKTAAANCVSKQRRPRQTTCQIVDIVTDTKTNAAEYDASLELCSTDADITKLKTIKERRQTLCQVQSMDIENSCSDQKLKTKTQSTCMEAAPPIVSENGSNAASCSRTLYFVTDIEDVDSAKKLESSFDMMKDKTKIEKAKNNNDFGNVDKPPFSKAINRRLTSHQLQDIDVDLSSLTKSICSNSHKDGNTEAESSFLKPSNSSVSFLNNCPQTTNQNLQMDLDTTKFHQTLCQNTRKEGDIETETSIEISKSNLKFLKSPRETTQQEQEMAVNTNKFTKPIYQTTQGDQTIESEISVQVATDSFLTKTKELNRNFRKVRRQTTYREQDMEVDTTKFTKPMDRTSHGDRVIEAENSIEIASDSFLAKTKDENLNLRKDRRQTTYREQDMEVDTTKFTKSIHRITHGDRVNEAENSLEIAPDSFLTKTKDENLNLRKDRRQTTYREQDMEVDTTKFTKPMHRTSHGDRVIEAENSIEIAPDSFLTKTKDENLNIRKDRRQTTHQEQDMEVDTKPIHKITRGERVIEAENSLEIAHDSFLTKTIKKSSLNLQKDRRQTTHQEQDIEVESTKFVASLDNLGLQQPGNESLNISPSRHQTTCYFDEDIETNNSEKPLKSNEEFSSGTKRLPINLTPNLPLSKKRPTIIFNNSNNENLGMEIDDYLESQDVIRVEQSICTPKKTSNSRELNSFNKFHLNVSVPKECQSTSAKKRQQISRIPVPITGRSPYASPFPPVRYVEENYDIDQSVQVARRKTFQDANSFSYKWDAALDMGQTCDNLGSCENLGKSNILPIYEGNVITISDVSAHFLAQKNMGKTFLTNSNQKLNENKNFEENRESDEFTKEEFKGIARLNTMYMNLTSDTTAFSAAFPERNSYGVSVSSSELLENTKLVLVETLINESENTNLTNKVGASILNESENRYPKPIIEDELSNCEQQNSNGKSYKEMVTASLCRKKCKYCASFDDTTSTSSFVLPQLPPAWPSSFPALEQIRRLRKKPTIAKVEENFRRKELAEHSCTMFDDLTFADSSRFIENKNDEPSIVYELKQSMEEVQKKIRNMPKPSPIVIYTDRLENLLQQTPNWISDYELESRNRYMFYHRRIAVMKIILEFDYKDGLHIDIQNATARFESTRLNKKYWNPLDYIVDFQLQLKLPQVIPSTRLNDCEAMNVFELLRNIDRTCVDIKKNCNKLWNIVCMKNAELKREGNRTLVRKFIRSVVQREDAYTFVYEEEFAIEINNIATISFKDIVHPKLYLFADHIQYAPKGLQFLNEFLENPKKYYRN